MSDIIHHIDFQTGGLNSDDSPIGMPKGDYQYALNIMVGEDGSRGVVTNAMGNLQIAYSQSLNLSSVYLCLGSYYNYLTRRCYFFVFGTPYLDIYTDPSPYTYKYDNRILCLNEDSQTIDTIYIDQHNYLSLDPKYLLTDMKMIETWLFYNPVSSQPRMIDVDMAYNFQHYPAWDDTDPSASAVLGDTYTWKGGLFVANTAISAGEDPSAATTKWDRIGSCYQDESTLDGTDLQRAFFAIKTPPVDRIKTSYGSDPSASFNNVEGKTFRFCHRYQYFDNSYSVFSAHSNITLPIDTELYNGEKPGSGVINNYIILSFSLYSPALVKNIELYFQELEGDWKRLAVIYRQDQTLLDDIDYTYDFYNNESYPTLAEGLADIVQDALPKLASAQEIINKNVLCYAGCTEGFNNIDKDLIDVTLTPEIKAIQASYENTIKVDNVTGDDITKSSELDPYGGNTLYYTWINVSDWFSTSGVVNTNLYKVSIGGLTGYRTLGSSDVDTEEHIADAMASAIRDLGVYASSYTIGGDVFVKIWGDVYISISQIYAIGASNLSLTRYGGFKTASYHPFCVFYYDSALRRGDAQLTPDMTVYVPSINEYSPPVTGTNYKWQVNWSVNHVPPSWARYWRWGYAGNRRCSYFVQYIVSSVADGSSVVNNSVAVDLTPLQTLKTTTTAGWNCYPNSNISPYEFTEGDRIRFITENTAPATPGTLLGDAIDGIYDFEIIKFDEETNVAYVKDFDFATASIGINTLVEIYTPRVNTVAEVYYEFGDILPIAYDTDGNLVHGGIIQNQSRTASPQAATGTFSYGDVYHIMRTPSKPLCTNSGELTNGVFHESMWWSDFYKSDDWDRGKLGLESPIGEKTLNIIRYSNVYLQNTSVNGITTFPVANQKELNDTYGDIIAIVEVGNQLKVLQEKKVASVGIGRTEYADAEGNITIVGSDQVLGVIRYDETNYGTTFPEGVVKNNRHVYFPDAYNGAICRNAANGTFPISGQYDGAKNGKMVTYFKNKFKSILTSGVEHCNVFLAWDEEYKMLYVSFKDKVNEENNETVVYHEPSDRWITFTEFEYTPEGGWNELLEPTFSIVRGFENGLGYSFDEESRFFVFNIGDGLGTPSNVSIFPSLLRLKYTIYDPTVSVLETPRTEEAVVISASSFTAHWGVCVGATGFFLDVATDDGFTSMVEGFNNLNVGNVRQYAVTGLDGRATYYYRVRSIDAFAVTSADSDTRTVSVTLAQPFATDATNPTNTSFSANWNASTTATGYRLDVSTDNAFSTFVEGFSNLDVSNVTTYSITGLAQGVLYWYRVRAYNAFQTSISSNIRWQITLAPPSVPVATGATNISNNSFVANWQSSQGASYYGIEVASDVSFTTLVLDTTTNHGDSTSRIVSGLSPQTNYYYRISAYNTSNIESGTSNIITVRTLMGSPVALDATNVYSQGFRARWYTIPGATAYYIDVATDVVFATLVKNNVNAGSGDYYDVTGLVGNTTYYYRISAYDGNQTTGNSNIITISTSAAPSVPTLVAATAILNNSFTINWYASTCSTGYYIDVATDILFANKLAGFNPASETGLSLIVTSLNSSTTYYYRIRSHDDYGISSDNSDTATVVTLAPTAPNPPVAVSATLLTTSGFTANWGAVAGATGYKLYVSMYYNMTNPVSGYDGLDVGNVTSYAVTGLLPARGYYYRLCAYNGAVDGSVGNIINVTTTALPLPTISLSPSSWNFGGKNINKSIVVTTTEATSWGISWPSLNGRIHPYSPQEANSVTLYYTGDFGTGDSVTFYATGAGGTTTTTFTGRWT